MQSTQHEPIADTTNRKMVDPVWTIVGSGAIGLLAAANAVLKGSPKVQLALRAQYTKCSSSASFAFSFCAGQQEYPILLSAVSPSTPTQTLLVPVKAYDVVNALKTYLPRLTDDAQIVLCHNGMGTIEQVLPLLSAEQGLWFASTTHGAYKSTPRRVVHSGQGKTILGALNPVAQRRFVAEQTSPDHADSVVFAIEQMLGPCEVVPDIMPFLWQKLVINLVINSLTAIHNVRNGALADIQYQEMIDRLVTEFLLVAKHSGQDFVAEQIKEKIAAVVTTTAENYSSMLQDVKNRRPLEAAYISGYLLEQGLQHQLELPSICTINQALSLITPA